MSGPGQRPTITHPALRPSLVAGGVEPDQVFLLTETKQYILIGKPYHVLAPLLDGSRTMGEVVEAASRHVSLPEAVFALEQLIRKGYVVEAGRGSVPAGVAAWWDAHGVHVDVATARVASTVVTVQALGNAMEHATDVLRAALEASGLRADGPAAAGNGAGPPARKSEVSVVLVRDALDPGLESVDAAHRHDGRPWILAKPVGTMLWLGPVFVPGRTACWHCLADRVRGNRQVERYVARHDGGVYPLTAVAGGHAPAALGAQAVVTAVESWVVVGTPPEALVGRIRTTDLTTWAVDHHEVVRRPQCPACGNPALRDPAREPAPIRLESRPKVFAREGGHRTEHPTRTLERLDRHVSPVTGVVSSLIRKEEPDNDRAFSYASGHDFVHQGHDIDALRGNLRFRSGGKGVSDVQAKVSAICEAVERWSGVWRGDEARVRGSAAALAGRALDVRDILCFSDRQYEERSAWNRTCSPTHYHVVPEPLDPAVELDWVHADGLGTGGRRLLPAAYAYYGHPDARRAFCSADANGTSAGNTLEEAVVQGFMELAERDAVAIWWYGRLSRPALDLASFGDPWVHDMEAFHRESGRDLWVLDLTHDLGIPVFAGVSRLTSGPSEDIITSFGAHFDPGVALRRAITEVNQFLPAVSPRNADGTTRYAYDDPDAIRWWSGHTLASEPYLLPSSAPARSAGDFGYIPREDIRDDVHACVAAAAGAGMETYVVDQTRPDVDLNVVRVVVPGMRHFWRRLGPGRLYDVPVDLGWRDAPLTEADLNPVSMFF